MTISTTSAYPSPDPTFAVGGLATVSSASPASDVAAALSPQHHHTAKDHHQNPHAGQSQSQSPAMMGLPSHLDPSASLPNQPPLPPPPLYMQQPQQQQQQPQHPYHAQSLHAGLLPGSNRGPGGPGGVAGPGGRDAATAAAVGSAVVQMLHGTMATSPQLTPCHPAASHLGYLASTTIPSTAGLSPLAGGHHATAMSYGYGHPAHGAHGATSAAHDPMAAAGHHHHAALGGSLSSPAMMHSQSPLPLATMHSAAGYSAMPFHPSGSAYGPAGETGADPTTLTHPSDKHAMALFGQASLDAARHVLGVNPASTSPHDGTMAFAPSGTTPLHHEFQQQPQPQRGNSGNYRLTPQQQQQPSAAYMRGAPVPHAPGMAPTSSRMAANGVSANAGGPLAASASGAAPFRGGQSSYGSYNHHNHHANHAHPYPYPASHHASASTSTSSLHHHHHGLPPSSSASSQGGGQGGSPPLERPLECPQAGCNLRFSHQAKLDRHMAMHAAERTFACPVPDCGKAYTRRDHLRRHGLTVHQNEMPDGGIGAFLAGSEPVNTVSCADCGQSFASRPDLYHHQTTAHRRAYLCNQPMCGASYDSLDALQQHESAHTDKKPHACTVEGCIVAFRRPGELQAHIRAQHDRPAFSCPIRECDANQVAFVDQTSWAAHAASHAGWRCATCEQVCSTLPGLGRHVYATHVPERIAAANGVTSNAAAGGHPAADPHLLASLPALADFNDCVLPSAGPNGMHLRFQPTRHACPSCSRSFHSPATLWYHQQDARHLRSGGASHPHNGVSASSTSASASALSANMMSTHTSPPTSMARSMSLTSSHGSMSRAGSEMEMSLAGMGMGSPPMAAGRGGGLMPTAAHGDPMAAFSGHNMMSFHPTHGYAASLVSPSMHGVGALVGSPDEHGIAAAAASQQQQQQQQAGAPSSHASHIALTAPASVSALSTQGIHSY